MEGISRTDSISLDNDVVNFGSSEEGVVQDAEAHSDIVSGECD